MGKILSLSMLMLMIICFPRVWFVDHYANFDVPFPGRDWLLHRRAEDPGGQSTGELNIHGSWPWICSLPYWVSEWLFVGWSRFLLIATWELGQSFVRGYRTPTRSYTFVKNTRRRGAVPLMYFGSFFLVIFVSLIWTAPNGPFPFVVLPPLFVLYWLPQAPG